MEISQNRKMNRKKTVQNNTMQFLWMKVKLLMFIKKKDKYKGKTWSRCTKLTFGIKVTLLGKTPTKFLSLKLVPHLIFPLHVTLD